MMDKTTPMKSKPLVDVTCKLGTKGCYEDGRCHALGNCENKISTFADKIRAMSDQELCDAIYQLIYAGDPATWYCKGTKECGDLIDTAEDIPAEMCKACLLAKLRQPYAEPKLPSGMFLDKQESGLLED